MSDERHEYMLGEEVTEIAKAKRQPGTVVVSIRLSVDEAARLEKIGLSERKSISQVIRNAIARYNPYHYETYAVITLTDTSTGTAVSVGEPRQASRGRESVTEWTEVVA